MTETKLVKIVFDGQKYWLLWHWNPYVQPTPDNLTGVYSHVSGPFDKESEAQGKIPDGWTPIPFKPSTH